MVQSQFIHFHCETPGDPAVNFRHPALWISHDGRHTRIGVLPNPYIERKATEQFNTVILAHFLAAPLSENMLLMSAVGTNMDTHVFYNAKDGYADFLKHLEPFPSIKQRNVLWRCNNYGSRHGNLLSKRQLNITRSRRHIHDEVIHLIPARIIQQLLQRLSHHRTPPYHWGLNIDEQTDRHGLNAMRFHWLNAFAIRGFRPSANAQHLGLRRAIDIRIQQAD